MGFDELVRELEKGAEAESRKILHASEKNAGKTVEGAKEKADGILKAARKEAAEFAKQEASEKETSAKLDAKKMLDEARDEAVEACILQVWQKFRSDALKKSSYPALLGKLVEEGAREIGAGQGAAVYVRDEDRGLAPGYALKKLPAEYSGGAIVESPNGKVRTNKTLEEIFAQKRPVLRKEIYDRLF